MIGSPGLQFPAQDNHSAWLGLLHRLTTQEGSVGRSLGAHLSRLDSQRANNQPADTMAAAPNQISTSLDSMLTRVPASLVAGWSATGQATSGRRRCPAHDGGAVMNSPSLP